MAGGLFAISRKFFWELGGYDAGLEIWGGEQYELSFKIWMCGGQLLDAPCSRIGHIYSDSEPGDPADVVPDFSLDRNYKRVAEVWMDEYAKFLFRSRPHYKDIDPGNLSELLKFRQKCKPFKWFMKKIAFDLLDHYPFMEPNKFAYGKIQSLASPQLCIEVSQINFPGDAMGLKNCKNILQQKFEYTWRKEIIVNSDMKSGQLCWDYHNNKMNVFVCHKGEGNQYFKYDVKNFTFTFSTTKKCLDCNITSHKLFLETCNSSSQTQRWKFEHINYQEIEIWNEREWNRKRYVNIG